MSDAPHTTLPSRFYLTGTDTDVGKTVTSAVLCHCLGLDYWKPVQSGLEGPTDTETVASLSGCRTWPERWKLPRPASPHASAEDVGVRIEASDFSLPPAKHLLVEGAGGWMVPYARKPTVWQRDVVHALKLPALVVARSGLGTLNHTLLTLRALRADQIPCLGVILVGPEHTENARDLAALGSVPILARIPRVEDPSREFERLTSHFNQANIKVHV